MKNFIKTIVIGFVLVIAFGCGGNSQSSSVMEMPADTSNEMNGAGAPMPSQGDNVGAAPEQLTGTSSPVSNEVRAELARASGVPVGNDRYRIYIGQERVGYTSTQLSQSEVRAAIENLNSSELDELHACLAPVQQIQNLSAQSLSRYVLDGGTRVGTNDSTVSNMGFAGVLLSFRDQSTATSVARLLQAGLQRSQSKPQ